MPLTLTEPTTTICLENLTFHAPIGYDSWGRPAKPTQPVSFSISVRIPLPRSDAISDDLSRSLDYSKLASMVLSQAQRSSGSETSNENRLKTPMIFHNRLCRDIWISHRELMKVVTMSTTLPVSTLSSAAKAIWHTRFQIRSNPANSSGGLKVLELADIHAATVIGIKDHEKLEAQEIRIHVRINLSRLDAETAARGTLAHDVVRDVVETVREARVGTVEALVAILWDMFLQKWCQPSKLKVLKPDAVAFVEGAGVAMEVEDENETMGSGSDSGEED